MLLFLRKHRLTFAKSAVLYPRGVIRFLFFYTVRKETEQKTIGKVCTLKPIRFYIQV